MKFRKNLYTVSISAAMLALAGCGITPQDEGSGASNPVSGLAVDGYLAGATVYVDVNENNKLDAWESRALTDNSGYFSTTPDGVDYCNDTAVGVDEADTAKKIRALRIHCLKAPAGYEEVMIRMTGGYDLATVEPFNGTISVKADLSAGGMIVATPVTGLLAEISADFTQAQIDAFIAREGLNPGGVDISKLDFLDFSASTEITDEAHRLTLLKLALQAHKVADVTAALLDPEYNAVNGNNADGFFGVNGDVPTDVSSYVYKAIVAAAVGGTDTIDTILTTQASLEAVITQAVANIDEGVIDEFNDRLPTDVDSGLPENPADMLNKPTVTPGPIAANVIKIAQTVSTVFGTPLVAADSYTDANSNVVNFTEEHDATSRMRAIDAVVYLTRSGAPAADVDSAKDWATLGDANTVGYLKNLKHPAVDMVDLKAKFVTGGVVLADSDYSGRATFDSLFGTNSAFSSSEAGGTVNTEGFGGNSLALDSPDGDDVSVDFGGTGAETSGDLNLSATFTEGDYAKTDESGNPVPLELDGTWEKIDDYTMLMNVEVTDGVFEPVIVKPDANGGYYFDLGGEQVSWGAPAP